MKIVGLTGGIGSGKSTIAKMFEELGIPVYDSDKNAKMLMISSEELKQDILGLFGDMAYLDGELNRKFIADKVFRDPELLEKLNKIIHPAVREHFLTWAQNHQSDYVIQESALIFENKNEDFYDSIILVTSPVETRIERVMQRDGSSKEDVKNRIENQMTDALKLERAHFHIDNDDLGTTRLKVFEIHSTLIKPKL